MSHLVSKGDPTIGFAFTRKQVRMTNRLGSTNVISDFSMLDFTLLDGDVSNFLEGDVNSCFSNTVDYSAGFNGPGIILISLAATLDNAIGDYIMWGNQVDCLGINPDTAVQVIGSLAILPVGAPLDSLVMDATPVAGLATSKMVGFTQETLIGSGTASPIAGRASGEDRVLCLFDGFYGFHGP